MNALKDIRPFEFAAARAGAPVGYADGEPAKIIVWDRPIEVCIVSLRGALQHVTEHYKSGETFQHLSPDLVMTPLGYIEGKPFFVGDEIEVFSLPDTWEKMAAEPRHKMRHEPEIRWPEPAKQYPVTGMTDAELKAEINIGDQSVEGRCRAVANAALRHAIDSATVATLEAYDQLRTDLLAAEQRNADRDMAVAEAVCNAVVATLARKQIESNSSTATVHLQTAIDAVKNMRLDLATIIAKVATP